MSLILRMSVFFGLSLVFTWGGILGNLLWPSNLWMQPMNPLGPLIAAPIAIVMTNGVQGLREWGGRLVNFRAPLWVYATALIGPVTIIISAVALSALTGSRIQPLPELEWIDFVLAIPIVLASGPIAEELAFRGYAQHEMQKWMSPLTAALIVGTGVAVWHAPLILAGEMGWPMALSVVVVSVVYAGLYRAGGSVWPLVVLHFSVNYFGPNYFGAMVAEPEGQFVYTLFFLAFYIAWAGWIVVRHGPELAGVRHSRRVLA